MRTNTSNVKALIGNPLSISGITMAPRWPFADSVMLRYPLYPPPGKVSKSQVLLPRWS